MNDPSSEYDTLLIKDIDLLFLLEDLLLYLVLALLLGDIRPSIRLLLEDLRLDTISSFCFSSSSVTRHSILFSPHCNAHKKKVMEALLLQCFEQDVWSRINQIGEGTADMCIRRTATSEIERSKTELRGKRCMCSSMAVSSTHPRTNRPEVALHGLPEDSSVVTVHDHAKLHTRAVAPHRAHILHIFASV